MIYIYIYLSYIYIYIYDMHIYIYMFFLRLGQPKLFGVLKNTTTLFIYTDSHSCIAKGSMAVQLPSVPFCRESLIIYERPPKPPTIRNSFTRTLVLDTIMKLSGTIGVTQKTMTFDTHVCQIFEFENIHPAS